MESPCQVQAVRAPARSVRPQVSQRIVTLFSDGTRFDEDTRSGLVKALADRDVGLDL